MTERMARIIIAQSHETLRSLLDQIPDFADKIVSVPKACCWFGNGPCDLKGITGCNPADVLFFLPAGLIAAYARTITRSRTG